MEKRLMIVDKELHDFIMSAKENRKIREGDALMILSHETKSIINSIFEKYGESATEKLKELLDEKEKRFIREDFF